MSLKTIIGLLLLTPMAMLFSACRHKDLCYTHPHKARVRVNVDWSQFRVEKPTGMSVLFYSTEGGGNQQTVLSNNTAFVETDLAVGKYRAMVYNQSPSEFGSVSFSGMENLQTAAVYANTQSSRWYNARTDEEQVITAPEWIGTTVSGTLEVTREMVEATNILHGSKPAPETNILGTLVPQNIIYTITVNIYMKGIYNLRSVRASLNGMATGYEFGQQRASEQKGTQLLENWSITTDKVNPTQGVVTTKIRSFGLPHSHKGEAEENTLTVSFLLVDNKTKLNYTFKVGDSFIQDTDNELSLRIDKEIANPLPDVKPEGGTAGGFDAKVDDWGKEENFDIGV